MIAKIMRRMFALISRNGIWYGTLNIFFRPGAPACAHVQRLRPHA